MENWQRPRSSKDQGHKGHSQDQTLCEELSNIKHVGSNKDTLDM